MKRKILQIAVFSGILLLGMQSVFAQKQKSTSKSALTDEIIAVSLPAFPMSIHKKFYDSVASEIPNLIQNNLKEGVKTDIDNTSTLSKPQKDKLKSKIPDLFARSQPAFKRIIDSRFGSADNVVTQIFKDDYAKYSVGEIIELHRFLTSDAGKSYLASLSAISQNMNNSRPKPLEIKEKYQPEISGFLTSETGQKFNQTFAFSPETMKNKILSMTKDVLQEINADQELDTIYKDFKANGYK